MMYRWRISVVHLAHTSVGQVNLSRSPSAKKDDIYRRRLPTKCIPRYPIRRYNRVGDCNNTEVGSSHRDSSTYPLSSPVIRRLAVHSNTQHPPAFNCSCIACICSAKALCQMNSASTTLYLSLKYADTISSHGSATVSVQGVEHSDSESDSNTRRFSGMKERPPRSSAKCVPHEEPMVSQQFMPIHEGTFGAKILKVTKQWNGGVDVLEHRRSFPIRLPRIFPHHLLPSNFRRARLSSIISTLNRY